MRRLVSAFLVIATALLISGCLNGTDTAPEALSTIEVQDVEETTDSYIETDEHINDYDENLSELPQELQEPQEPAEPQADNEIPVITSIKQLEDTKHFGKHALEHIFYGQVNSKGKATGYHTESIPNSHGSVVKGTESKPNEHGVYTAKVTVNGKSKSGNKGMSSLYPRDWDAQTVVDAINEAFENKEFVKGSDNVYRGLANDSVVIEMYLDNNNKIISAFPIY